MRQLQRLAIGFIPLFCLFLFLLSPYILELISELLEEVIRAGEIGEEVVCETLLPSELLNYPFGKLNLEEAQAWVEDTFSVVPKVEHYNWDIALGPMAPFSFISLSNSNRYNV